MSRYLLVPGDPSSVQAAVRQARRIADAAPESTFVLLLPRPRSAHNRHVAEHLAAAQQIVVATQLRQAGVHLERSIIGDESPLLAITDELRLARQALRPTTDDHIPGDAEAYDAVVLATRRPGLARLVGLDVQVRAEDLPLPVVHVYADGGPMPPDPLTWRLRHRFSRLLAPARRLARAVEQRRLGLVLIVLPMVLYLSIGVGLAVFVNRRFFFTDAIALGLDVTLVCGLIALERTEHHRLRRRLLIEESVDATVGARRRSPTAR